MARSDGLTKFDEITASCRPQAPQPDTRICFLLKRRFLPKHYPVIVVLSHVDQLRVDFVTRSAVNTRCMIHNLNPAIDPTPSEFANHALQRLHLPGILLHVACRILARFCPAREKKRQ